MAGDLTGGGRRSTGAGRPPAAIGRAVDVDTHRHRVDATLGLLSLSLNAIAPPYPEWQILDSLTWTYPEQPH